MRRRLLVENSIIGIKSKKAVAGDVCLINKSTKEIIIVPKDYWHENYNKEFGETNYYALGVVVVPGTHNVYGDGSCAICGVRHAYASGNGVSADAMYWGVYGDDVSGLINMSKVCHCGNGNMSSIYEMVQGLTDYAYMPSTVKTSLVNPFDTDTYYSSTSVYYVPSPYNEDDSRNIEYRRTSLPSSSDNVLSDYNGEGNTKRCVYERDMGSYTYVQAYVPEHYPAASACLEYYSSIFDNTQGKWYLPSAAELGYVLPKLNIINQTINDLSYYNPNIKTFTDQAYWTSSESDEYNAWYISFYNKTISKYSKDSSYYVRPFLKVKI